MDATGRRGGEDRCCRCEFEMMLMVPGGAGSTWGLAEQQAQVLAVIRFALRNTFLPLNSFSRG